MTCHAGIILLLENCLLRSYVHLLGKVVWHMQSFILYGLWKKCALGLGLFFIKVLRDFTAYAWLWPCAGMSSLFYTNVHSCVLLSRCTYGPQQHSQLFRISDSSGIRSELGSFCSNPGSSHTYVGPLHCISHQEDSAGHEGHEPTTGSDLALFFRYVSKVLLYPVIDWAVFFLVTLILNYCWPELHGLLLLGVVVMNIFLCLHVMESFSGTDNPCTMFLLNSLVQWAGSSMEHIMTCWKCKEL